MPSISSNRTHLLVLRLQQLLEFYQLDATTFAVHIQIEPTRFCQLLALDVVEAEVVLEVIDQLHHKMKLDFGWFLTYDLEVVSDLADCLNTLLYNRDALPKRIKTRRESIQ